MASKNDADPNLQEIHDFLIDLAIKAGKVITSSLPRIDSTGSKKNSEYPLYHNWPDRRKKGQQGRMSIYWQTWLGSDLVTEYDRAVERMVSEALKTHYPNYEYGMLLGLMTILSSLLTEAFFCFSFFQLSWRRDLWSCTPSYGCSHFHRWSHWWYCELRAWLS